MLNRWEKSHRPCHVGKGMSGEISYRGIIQNSRNLAWVLDTQGNFILFNKRSQDVSGYRSRDIVGRSFAELVYPPEDLPRIQKIFSAVMEGRLLQYELTLIKAGGELLYLMVNTSPVYDVNGRIIGTLSFGQDVTDQACLERVITNLVDNAAKYSAPGSTVSVKVEIASASVVFGVSDEGEGIPVEKQAKLFSLFERLGRERIDGDRGTGVGLAVCKLLVQASGGKIWLDSEVGKGSTFYFSLPLRE